MFQNCYSEIFRGGVFVVDKIIALCEYESISASENKWLKADFQNVAQISWSNLDIIQEDKKDIKIKNFKKLCVKHFWSVLENKLADINFFHWSPGNGKYIIPINPTK